MFVGSRTPPARYSKTVHSPHAWAPPGAGTCCRDSPWNVSSTITTASIARCSTRGRREPATVESGAMETVVLFCVELGPGIADSPEQPTPDEPPAPMIGVAAG